jgi:hypothetical protein
MTSEKLLKRLDYFNELALRLDTQIGEQVEQLMRVEYAFYKTVDELSIQRIVELCQTGR